MRKHILPVIFATASLYGGTGCSGLATTTISPIPSTWPVLATGSLNVTTSWYGEVIQSTCAVDTDFVLVGGGAWADYPTGGAGALLTASYPDSSLTKWTAASKDHDIICPHTLHVYAIGLRLAGVDRTTLANAMVVQTVTSGTSEYPTASVSLPQGYQIIGGGACANYSAGGYGSLLTGSYPSGLNSWVASSKDHMHVCSASITSYAIGITTGQISGFGSLAVNIASSSVSSPAYQTPDAHQIITNGYVLSCLGGKATYNYGHGRMLFRIFPDNGEGANAYSKDHEVPDSGVTTAYSIMIRKQ